MLTDHTVIFVCLLLCLYSCKRDSKDSCSVEKLPTSNT